MTTPQPSDHIVLRAADTLIVIAAQIGTRARVLYAGPDLPGMTPEQLDQLDKRAHAPGGPAQPIAPSTLNTIGSGHPSPPGLLAHRSGLDWALDPIVSGVTLKGAATASVMLEDPNCGVKIVHHIEIERDSGVASFATTLHNQGDADLDLEWLSAICLPLDPRLTEIASFTGRWAGEFAIERSTLARGSFLRENRAGRTSHDSYPGVYLGTATTDETSGLASAFHLGWNGNHRMRIDHLSDDMFSLQAGPLLLPGEKSLAPGEEFCTGPLLASWSRDGYGEATRRLHQYVRAGLLQPKIDRPVHFNTWEAVYFDHSPEKLFALAEQAAEVGAERFVLDDGWFGARRHDRAGLGDWFVSADVYPDGLRPLADHVRNLGMEFGLWFEPEMVNPDSDLYRAHPNWVLAAPGVAPIGSRHQLPLDLTKSEVCDYLFDRIHALVDELGIAYIKWDMNRDIQHPGGADGRAVMHAQAMALHPLLHRLHSAHPGLVIESCSSGGARADYAMLERCHRVWTSDNNDARARHAIMRGAAHFLPLEALGNHVGPKKCHITGRRFDMHFRAGTAIFGHMGMELDLAQESDADRDILKRAIILHKQHRGLIHSGAYHRLETADHLTAIGVVAEDQSRALFQLAVLDQHPAPHPPRLRFAGIAPEGTYRVACLWPEFLAKPIGSFAGTALIEYGLQLPQTHPDTCLIYHLEVDQ